MFKSSACFVVCFVFPSFLLVIQGRRERETREGGREERKKEGKRKK